MIDATDRRKMQCLQMDDYVHWLNSRGEKQSDILQGWRISDRGNHTLMMRSGATCLLIDVVSRVRQGEELTFEDRDEE